jgi:O-antigen/teichoic acid export membrane protein
VATDAGTTTVPASVRDLDAATVRRRVLISVGSQILGQVAVSGLGLVFVKLMTVQLGAAEYGIYATAMAFVFTFSLLTDLGLTAVTAREVAKQPDRAGEIISQNMGLRLSLAAALVPVIYGLSFVFYPTQPQRLRTTVLILASYLVFDAVRQVSSAYFTAHIRNDIGAVIAVIQQAVLVGLAVLVLREGWGVIGFAVSYVAANASAAAVSVPWVRRRIRIMPRFDLRRWRAILAASISVGALQIINLVYLKVDGVVISVIKGPTAGGVYSVSYLLVSAFVTLPAFLMSALVPSLATASTQQTKSLADNAYRYMAVLGCLIASVGVVTSLDLVHLVSSEQFDGASRPFQILICANILVGLNVVFSYASVSLDRHRPLLKISITTLTVNLLLNLALVPFFSINGAAVATLASELLALRMMSVIFKRQTGVRIAVLANLYRPLAAGVLATAVTWVLFLHRLGDAAVVWRLLLQAGTACAAYLLALLIIGGAPTEITALCRRIPVVGTRIRKGRNV